LHGQPREHASPHHPLRSAPCRCHRAREAAWAEDGEPGHSCRDGDAAGEPLRGRLFDDRRRVPDRQGLRTNRRTPALPRRAHRSRRRLAPAGRDPARAVIAIPSLTMAATGQGRASARVNVAGRGETNVATGVPVLDHLLSSLAVYASFDLALEVAPGAPEAEIGIAGRSLGEALAEPLRSEERRGGKEAGPLVA